jgi:hypothetical protein
VGRVHRPLCAGVPCLKLLLVWIAGFRGDRVTAYCFWRSLLFHSLHRA